MLCELEGKAFLNHFHVLGMKSLHNTLLHSMNVIKGTWTFSENESLISHLRKRRQNYVDLVAGL